MNEIVRCVFCLIGGVAIGWFLGGWVMWQSVKNNWNHPWRGNKWSG